MNFNFENIIDISPLVSPKTAVFPGDTPFSRNVVLDMSEGKPFTLSSVTTTVHIGSHADAPVHYHPQGQDISVRTLLPYFGECQVLEVPLQKRLEIKPHHLKEEIKTKRILFKTLSHETTDVWENNFSAFTPELIHFLADKDVTLLGIDTPSVDLADAKILNTHHAVYERNISLLEGLVLKDVPPGLYFLTALPLRWQGCDASPVRAILCPQKR